MQVPGPVYRSNTLPEQFPSFEFLIPSPASPKVGSVQHWLEALPDDVLGLVLTYFTANELPKVLACLAGSSSSGARLAVRGFNSLDASLRRQVGSLQSWRAVERARRLDGPSRAALLARAARHAAATGALFAVPVEHWASLRDSLTESSFRPGLDLISRLPFHCRAARYADENERRDLGSVATVLAIVRDAMALYPDALTRRELALFIRPSKGDDLSPLIEAVREYGQIKALALEGTLESIASLSAIVSLPATRKIHINLLPSPQKSASLYELCTALLHAPGLEHLSLTGHASSASFPAISLILTHLRAQYSGILTRTVGSELAWPKIESKTDKLRIHSWAPDRRWVDAPARKGPRGTKTATAGDAILFARAEGNQNWFSDYMIDWPRFTQSSPGEFVREQMVCGRDRQRRDDPKHLEAVVVANASFFVDDLCRHASQLRQFDLICCTQDERLWDSLSRLLQAAPALERLTVVAPHADGADAFLKNTVQYEDRLDYLLLMPARGSALYALRCRSEANRLEVKCALWTPGAGSAFMAQPSVQPTLSPRWTTDILLKGRPVGALHGHLVPGRETGGS